MTTYVYETVPVEPGVKPKRFEIQQSMRDEALARHPETGEPVRRIVAGGFGFIAQKAEPPPRPCGARCDCQCECQD